MKTINLHYDGHGMNDEEGRRVLTFAKKPDKDGGGYTLSPEEREVYAAFITAIPDLFTQAVRFEMMLLSVKRKKFSPTAKTVNWYLSSVISVLAKLVGNETEDK